MFEGYQRIGVHCGALHKSLLQQVHTRTGCFGAARSKKHAARMSLHHIASIIQSITARTTQAFCLFVCFCFLIYFGSPDVVHGRINEFA